MAAVTFASLGVALLAITVKAQPPYTASPPDFVELYPQAISYAEGRIYKDIPFLATRQQNTTLSTAAGSRALNLASMTNASGGPIIVPEGLALIVPTGTTNPALGTRVPYDEATLDAIDLAWPTEATVVTPSITDWMPRLWALRDANTIVYCPTADATYTAEITGLYQPTPMSPTNETTYLGSVYPELLEAACMIFLTGALLHNYGAQSSAPQQGLSWEGIYSGLLVGARNEELRRRGLEPDAPLPTAER